ncbi:MAG: hypothetical protein OMM_03357 [Candidatus Magnetoglobus multicellularis str. Araruama]|uniref:Cysteine-rich domain-containing protein n=1 Tax=Candidatus Magnetoglobus multicellularis str. Araruama TaxID=890399 RepID=A0A1V1P5Y2_9BACT|nr:MAG: hypothetical protein OMM_03357 [Candidatus Magnetoglobus multicellularis str. Araruama]
MVHAAALARQNIDTIDKLSPDIILTTCASCGAQIHRWPELLKHESDYDARARNIANSQKDATSFVLENCYPIEHLSSQCSNENILYHHPCHMRWGETKASVPNELFEPFDKIKVNYSDSLCCGNGGKFQISHFDLSMNIFDQRLDLFAKYAINYVLTPCTGCQLQFCEGLLQKGISVPVLHPLAWLHDIGCIE